MLNQLPNLWPYLIAGMAAVLTLLGYGARQKTKGRKGAETKAQETDDENADEIRDRVEHDLDGQLHKHDNDGWRD